MRVMKGKLLFILFFFCWMLGGILLHFLWVRQKERGSLGIADVW